MTRIPLLAASFLILGAASAFAQGAPNPPPPPPGGPAAGMQRPMEGRGGYMDMRARRMMMFQRAAGFRFRKDGAEIDIKCSASESTKDCVDAAGVLIDKINSITPKQQ